jgi:hypothetical protein
VALGPTHYNWRPDVYRVVQRTLSAYPRLTANSYVGHPWPGWGHLSADFWDAGGRGDPLPPDLAWDTARYLLNLPGLPLIRHLIVEHSLWTSWGGWSAWRANDHDGRLRHTHVTYWPRGEGSAPKTT